MGASCSSEGASVTNQRSRSNNPQEQEQDKNAVIPRNGTLDFQETPTKHKAARTQQQQTQNGSAVVQKSSETYSGAGHTNTGKITSTRKCNFEDNENT